VAGYEIVEEIGRGGMGVVYKARDPRLKRLVALKMVLAGEHAGGAELERFHTEAKAVARLQHPGIVQIFEVGEHDGKPFIALEYVGGGSLAERLRRGPVPVAEAVELMIALAGAVQAAHAAGVVHRDLKPANVLLTEAGQPKVGDFGLAKFLDAAARHTASGAVLGTPSYMAPEQAGTGLGKVGPATDVYALGAILYELLTGRPPFQAGQALETILQVVADEPPSPRSLRRDVPRDLETICLKCLQKAQARRYASAADLADDLERFRAGEPIRARRENVWERALRWMKEQPWVAVRAGLAFLLMLGLSLLFLGGWAWLATATATVLLFQGARLGVAVVAAAVATGALATAGWWALSRDPEGDMSLVKPLTDLVAKVARERSTQAAFQRAERDSDMESWQFEMQLLILRITPESLAWELWRAARYGYLAALVLSGGLFLGVVVGFWARAGKDGWAVRWCVPALAVLLVAWLCVWLQTSAAFIGGVWGGLTVAVVGWGVAGLLRRDRIAGLQGAIFGAFVGLLAVVLFVFGGGRFRAVAEWQSRTPLGFLLQAAGIVCVSAVVGAVRGALGANPPTSRLRKKWLNEGD
jgi:tRNA A-37 threonylcarbamoyl transferase component Bud32